MLVKVGVRVGVNAGVEVNVGVLVGGAAITVIKFEKSLSRLEVS